MAPEPLRPRESPEHSIKARKHELYESEEEQPAAAPAPPRKPFPVYLRETPPAPLSTGLKVLLWGVGVLVVFLFVAALVWGRSPRIKRPARPKTQVRQAMPPNHREARSFSEQMLIGEPVEGPSAAMRRSPEVWYSRTAWEPRNLRDACIS
jgi:hypothetical protein